ncbi:MAG: serine/threonine protein kinase, partial [Chloroflexota bacterium]
MTDESVMDQMIGRTLNRYKIMEILGEGGVGAVFKAYDDLLQRQVAVKVMRPDFARRPNFRDRFLQEARTAARLDHPSIVEVHDFGQDNDLLYIVMEYIPGDNLRAMLQRLKAQNKWVILSEAVQIVQQVSDAIAYAHGQGVLHRDIKPENLMLKPEPGDHLPYRVVITDLGLAQLGATDSLAKDGISMGTPAYMSPEQALGQETDERSDVYSLGVLLYELAVGRLPFPASTISEAARYHAQEQVPLPRSIRSDLPIALEKVILKALEKSPANRYAGVPEFLAALEEALPVVDDASFTPSDISETVSLTTQYEVAATVAEETMPMDSSAAADTAGDVVEILEPDHSER